MELGSGLSQLLDWQYAATGRQPVLLGEPRPPERQAAFASVLSVACSVLEWLCGAEEDSAEVVNNAKALAEDPPTTSNLEMLLTSHHEDCSTASEGSSEIQQDASSASEGDDERPQGGDDVEDYAATCDLMEMPPELPEELAVEALCTVLGSAGPSLLRPDELTSAACVSRPCPVRLAEGCELRLSTDGARRPALEVEALRATPAARKLHRADVLRGLRRQDLAVCIGHSGNTRRLALVADGLVHTAVGHGARAYEFEPILPPLPPASAGGAPQSPAMVSVCLSPCAILAVDEAGEVYTADCADRENRLVSKLRWFPVSSLKGVKAKAVYSRFGQIYVVTRTGDMYAWGFASGDFTPSRACSLGLPGGPADIPEPVCVTGTPEVDRFGFGRAPICSVACGGSHAIFVCRTGEAFAVGQGGLGQLGNRALADATVPTRVAMPPEVRVRAAACGLRHSLLATASGEAYGCGYVSSGELPLRRFSPGALPPDLAANGFATWSFETVPRKLDLLPRADEFFIVAIACGISTSFFLGDNGQVRFTGSVPGDHAPFERPKQADPKVPHRIPHLPPTRSLAVSLNVPFKLPGVPFATMPVASEGEPAEIVVFWARDEPVAYAWGSPGGARPRLLGLEASEAAAFAAALREAPGGGSSPP